jgi:hypothetical protein
MLFDLVAWQAACVQVIKREAEALGGFIEQVYKASTGTWYVRVVVNGRKCSVRLSDHRARAVSWNNRHLLSIVRRSTGKLRMVGAFLAAGAVPEPRRSSPP